MTRTIQTVDGRKVAVREPNDRPAIQTSCGFVVSASEFQPPCPVCGKYPPPCPYQAFYELGDDISKEKTT